MTIVLRQKPLVQIVQGVVKNNNGCWLDPSDVSTLYQDDAGTIPVTSVEQPVGLVQDKSGNGYHATQPITASRPTMSARKNLLLATEVLTTQSVTTKAAPYILSFEGTGSITLSGSSTASLVGTGANTRISTPVIPQAGSLTLTVTGDVRKAQLEAGTVVTKYQRVTTSTDYDVSAHYYFLRFDGIDDYLNLPYMGLYDNGKSSVVALTNSTPQLTDAYLVSERNLANATQKYIPIKLTETGVIDSLIVNDANTTISDSIGTTYDVNNLTVRSSIDNGQNLNVYKDGLLAGYDEYTRSGTLTLNNTTIGASISTTNSNFVNTDLYGLVITKSALNDSERRSVEQHLARKADVGIYDLYEVIDGIGVAGEAGFGVGVLTKIPDGYSAFDDSHIVGSDNHGNYKYLENSVMVCVPQFWERYGHIDNPTYALFGEDSVDIKPSNFFATEAVANAAGYSLNRAFIDGNQKKPFFMVDKYICSNNNGIASSIKNGNCLSSNFAHNPFSALRGAPENVYGGAWAAAKTRGKEFFVTSRFIYAALALLSLAHGQSATSTTNCAWYDPTQNMNYPKGCNNNAFRDADDASVVYTPEGYDNCGKTGSGVPFAKTTHNGQNSGVADLNGLMWEISQGVSCIATSRNITAATKTNPVLVTMTAHGITTETDLMITGVVGMTQLNDRIFDITVIDANTISLNGVDGTSFTAYTSGGSGTFGKFYVAKESVIMSSIKGGNTTVNDHFGTNGVLNNMLEFKPAFRTDYPNNGFTQRLGNNVNKVLSSDITGNGKILRSLGLPIKLGLSPTGANRFGKDYFYQYIRNELCLISGADWSDGSAAGAWASLCYGARWDSLHSVGFRSASFPCLGQTIV